MTADTRDLRVSIDAKRQTFVASDPDRFEVSLLSWEWAREKGARFRAELRTVAVDPDGIAIDEPPGGWLIEEINDKGQTELLLPPDLRAVVSGGAFDATNPRRGWTISQRWKMLAWSPITARVEFVEASELPDGVEDPYQVAVWVRADGAEIARSEVFQRPAPPTEVDVLEMIPL